MTTVNLISSRSSPLPQLSSLFQPFQPGLSLTRSPAPVSNNLPDAKIKEHISLRLTAPQWHAAPLSTRSFSKTLLWPPGLYTFLKFSYLSGHVCQHPLLWMFSSGLKVPKDSTLSPILFHTLSECMPHSVDCKDHRNTSNSWISSYSWKLHSGFQTPVSNCLPDSASMSHRDLNLMCPHWSLHLPPQLSLTKSFHFIKKHRHLPVHLNQKPSHSYRLPPPHTSSPICQIPVIRPTKRILKPPSPSIFTASTWWPAVPSATVS